MCVGRSKRLFYCLCGGGGTRAPSSSSPLQMIGPVQSAGRVWPKRGGGAKGRSFVGFRREKACSCVEGANERANEELVNNFSLAEVQKLQSVERVLVCRSERTREKRRLRKKVEF